MDVAGLGWFGHIACLGKYILLFGYFIRKLPEIGIESATLVETNWGSFVIDKRLQEAAEENLNQEYIFI